MFVYRFILAIFLYGAAACGTAFGNSENDHFFDDSVYTEQEKLYNDMRSKREAHAQVQSALLYIKFLDGVGQEAVSLFEERAKERNIELSNVTEGIFTGQVGISRSDLDFVYHGLLEEIMGVALKLNDGIELEDKEQPGSQFAALKSIRAAKIDSVDRPKKENGSLVSNFGTISLTRDEIFEVVGNSLNEREIKLVNAAIILYQAYDMEKPKFHATPVVAFYTDDIIFYDTRYRFYVNDAIEVAFNSIYGPLPDTLIVRIMNGSSLYTYPEQLKELEYLVSSQSGPDKQYAERKLRIFHGRMTYYRETKSIRFYILTPSVRDDDRSADFERARAIWLDNMHTTPAVAARSDQSGNCADRVPSDDIESYLHDCTISLTEAQKATRALAQQAEEEEKLQERLRNERLAARANSLFGVLNSLAQSDGSFSTTASAAADFLETEKKIDQDAHDARARKYALEGKVCEAHDSVVFCYSSTDTSTSYLGKGVLLNNTRTTNHCPQICGKHIGFCDVRTGRKYPTIEAAERDNCRAGTKLELETILK
jgi:hypothetical protein